MSNDNKIEKFKNIFFPSTSNIQYLTQHLRNSINMNVNKLIEKIFSKSIINRFEYFDVTCNDSSTSEKCIEFFKGREEYDAMVVKNRKNVELYYKIQNFLNDTKNSELKSEFLDKLKELEVEILKDQEYIAQLSSQIITPEDIDNFKQITKECSIELIYLILEKNKNLVDVNNLIYIVASSVILALKIIIGSDYLEVEFESHIFLIISNLLGGLSITLLKKMEIAILELTDFNGCYNTKDKYLRAEKERSSVDTGKDKKKKGKDKKKKRKDKKNKRKDTIFILPRSDTYKKKFELIDKLEWILKNYPGTITYPKKGDRVLVSKDSNYHDSSSKKKWHPGTVHIAQRDGNYQIIFEGETKPRQVYKSDVKEAGTRYLIDMAEKKMLK
jgi:hypothetical protein